jgi:hypothetical protein
MLPKRCLLVSVSFLRNGFSEAPLLISFFLRATLPPSISSPPSPADPSFQVVRVVKVGVSNASDVVVVVLIEKDVFAGGVVLARERRGGSEAFWRIEHNLWAKGMRGTEPDPNGIGSGTDCEEGVSVV